MKPLLLLITLSFLMSSCSVFRKAREKYEEESALGLDKNYKSFVLKKDSSIVEYDALKVKRPLFGKEKFILDGNTEILAKEVIAYQNGSTYYTYTSLCGWSTRRINLAPISKYQGTYTTTTTERNTTTGFSRTSTNVHYQNYIQKNNGSLLNYTAKNLSPMVENCAASVDLLNEYNETNKKLKRIGRINTFVGLASMVMMLSGDQSSSKVGVVPAIGLGGFLGSVTYGFINRRKKSKTFSYVEEAYDEYNAYMKKKKK
jgi:hypothetical protein